MKRGFFKFDVPNRKLTPVESPDDLTRCQAVSHDAANHVVIALAKNKVDKYRQTVVPWSLDIKTRKWTRLDPSTPAPVGQTTGNWGTFWYDPAHNVHLLINCVRRDRNQLFDGGVTETWAYHYRHVP